jgi:amidase
MSSVLSTQPWLRDPEVVTIPWRQDLVDSTLSRASPDGSSNQNLPLKLGIYWTDGVVGPQPPIIRGLHAVVNTLRKAGHKVKPNPIDYSAFDC